MADKGYALAREELVRALTAYTGITTTDGATPANNTLICADLIGRNDFITEKTILIVSGDAKDEDKGAASFNTVNGTVTLQTGFSAQIKAGTIFRVLNISSVEINVAAIEAKLDLLTPAGTFTYLDAGGEQTIFTFTPTEDTIIHSIWLDLNTLTQNTTIRLKHQIDGANYRTFETFNWTTGMDDGAYFRNIGVKANRPVQVTIQETADEGADRNIPYYYAYEER